MGKRDQPPSWEEALRAAQEPWIFPGQLQSQRPPWFGLPAWGSSGALPQKSEREKGEKGQVEDRGQLTWDFLPPSLPSSLVWGRSVLALVLGPIRSAQQMAWVPRTSFLLSTGVFVVPASCQGPPDCISQGAQGHSFPATGERTEPGGELEGAAGSQHTVAPPGTTGSGPGPVPAVLPALPTQSGRKQEEGMEEGVLRTRANRAPCSATDMRVPVLCHGQNPHPVYCIN